VKKFPKILGIYSNVSATSQYRIARPMKALSDCGYPAYWANIDDIDDRMLPFYDVVLMSRTGTAAPEVMRKELRWIKDQGCLLWLDYDDDVFSIPDHNPGKHEFTDGFVTAMEEASAVIATSVALASRFRQYAHRTSVIPNYMDPASWPNNTPRLSEKLTIGLTGSPTHVRDWEIIERPMRRIKERHDVTFVVAGMLPDYLKDVVDMYIDWVPLQEYPYLINSIDIGLCPLIDDTFNGGKSPIKALELGLAGAAIVASPTQYLDVVRGKGTIARTEAEWEAAIEKYVTDKQKRFVAGRSMRDYVEKRWDVYKHVDLIAKTYAGLYHSCIEGKKAQAA
jgi:glycosyltransferase involved in cell wall biosynthesis